MNEHTLTWAIGSIVAMVTVVAAAFATRVQLLPEVIDVSIIPTGSGVASLASSRMYSKSLMVRALAPRMLIAMLIAMGSGLAYGLGGPAWLVYAALLVGALVVLPGYIRWDEHQHPRH